ncbi:hypothetical protein SISNIDRAFT_464061 [Sistotremastrum niveocremeum HHB9708]|uniref:Uncharacterized protein n=1 Tax=Sistotremastrum niveocremeum HHB9708 TaxID=1314777 RepID=A0A164X7N4_9AGAM|nr:hypothetical protein SISNIDRAFT_464061 [Sistotremastrum niveocremeum HHB9708]
MAWTFNLRSGYLSSDSDDPKDDNDSKPASRPDELFDLSSREDHATFVPNPWSLAKLNAASKKKPSQPVKKDPKSSYKPASKPSSNVSTKPAPLNDSFPSSDGTLVDENDVPTRTTKPLSSFPTNKSNAKSNNAQKVIAQAPPARIIPSASVKSRPPKLATYKFHRDPVQTKPPPPSKEKVVSNTIDSRISSSTPSDPDQLPATRRLTRDPKTSKPPVSTRPEDIFRPVESFVNAYTSNTLSESPAWTKPLNRSYLDEPEADTICEPRPMPFRSAVPVLDSVREDDEYDIPLPSRSKSRPAFRDIYESFQPDGDKEWSTLPSRKKARIPAPPKKLPITTKFRLPPYTMRPLDKVPSSSDAVIPNPKLTLYMPPAPIRDESDPFKEDEAVAAPLTIRRATIRDEERLQKLLNERRTAF